MRACSNGYESVRRGAWPAGGGFPAAGLGCGWLAPGALRGGASRHCPRTGPVPPRPSRRCAQGKVFRHTIIDVLGGETSPRRRRQGPEWARGRARVPPARRWPAACAGVDPSWPLISVKAPSHPRGPAWLKRSACARQPPLPDLVASAAAAGRGARPAWRFRRMEGRRPRVGRHAWRVFLRAWRVVATDQTLGCVAAVRGLFRTGGPGRASALLSPAGPRASNVRPGLKGNSTSEAGGPIRRGTERTGPRITAKLRPKLRAGWLLRWRPAYVGLAHATTTCSAPSSSLPAGSGRRPGSRPAPAAKPRGRGPAYEFPRCLMGALRPPRVFAESDWRRRGPGHQGPRHLTLALRPQDLATAYFGCAGLHGRPIPRSRRHR